MPYPWQMKQWRQVRLAVEQERLAHSLLLSGAEGCGIRQFAHELARYLLCEATVQGKTCGQCRPCILLNAGNHPDMLVVNPEDDSSQIKVDTIRDLVAYLQLSNQYGRYKIVIIEPAEEMNWYSANSLLKTLEEPAESTLLMLISYQPGRLPVTLRSRCRHIRFNQVDRKLACDWLGEQINEPEQATALLELSGGAPLKALELNETNAAQIQRNILADLQEARRAQTDPVKIAEQWQNYDGVEVLTWLLFLFSKMAAIRCAGMTENSAKSFIEQELHGLANGLQLSQLIDCYELALRNYRLLTDEFNLNKQNLLEQIIIHWQYLSTGETAEPISG